jgi:hypothetical protein
VADGLTALDIYGSSNENETGDDGETGIAPSPGNFDMQKKVGVEAHLRVLTMFRRQEWRSARQNFARAN